MTQTSCQRINSPSSLSSFFFFFFFFSFFFWVLQKSCDPFPSPFMHTELFLSSSTYRLYLSLVQSRHAPST